MYGLSGNGGIDISHHLSEVSLTHLYLEFLNRCPRRFVDDLVDGHFDGAGILKHEVVVASFQRHRDNGLVPIISSYFLEVHFLNLTIHRRLHLSGFAAVTVAHANVVFSTLGQVLQLMAQGTIGIGLCLHKAQTGKVLVILCPPSGIGQFVVHTLAVHILGLDDNRAFIGFRLLGQFEFLCRQHVGLTVGGCTLTVDLHNNGTHVLDSHREGLVLGIIFLAVNGVAMSG